MKTRCIKKVLNAGGKPFDSSIPGTKAIFDYEVRTLPVDYFEKVCLNGHFQNAMISLQIDSGSEDYQSLKNEDLSKIDDTRQDWPHGYGQPMELVFGKKFQLEVFEECLKSMLVDEVSRAFVPMCVTEKVSFILSLVLSFVWCKNVFQRREWQYCYKTPMEVISRCIAHMPCSICHFSFMILAKVKVSARRNAY